MSALALAVAFAGASCEAEPDETLAGLTIVSPGSISVTNAKGEPESADGAPDGVRHVTAANGWIAVMKADHEVLVSEPARPDGSRAWQRLTFEVDGGRTPTGMDLSPDATELAIVLGDPDTPGLELVMIDVASGKYAGQPIEVMANGPPIWLSTEVLLLEVIRPDQHSGIATLDRTTGVVTVTDARGFAPSATRDGSRVAVAGPSGVVISEATSWLGGDPVDSPALAPPADSSVLDVALDADGTRLAVAYAASSGGAASVVILRRVGTVWETMSTIPVLGNDVVSIDWLQ